METNMNCSSHALLPPRRGRIENWLEVKLLIDKKVIIDMDVLAGEALLSTKNEDQLIVTMIITGNMTKWL